MNFKKRLLSILLCVVMIASMSIATLATDTPRTVNPTPSTVYVNGVETAFEAYNIGGSNYFKLRDLAFVLNGTQKQFEVGYDNTTKAITLTSGQPYTAVGSEMIQGDGKSKNALPTPSTIYLDGEKLNLTVYIIGGNNFFKLRELMEVLDVFVGYDGVTKAITLETSKGYEPESPVAQELAKEPEEPVEEPVVLTEEQVYNTIMALQSQYPHEMKWTNENRYVGNNGAGYRGCWAFAMILSDAAFGNLPMRQQPDLDNIRIGDIIINSSRAHVSIVTGVDGDEIIFASGNVGEEILWGLRDSLDFMKRIGYTAMTRWPK